MEKREKIMTALILTSLLFCDIEELSAVSYSLNLNDNQIEVPHDHLPEEDVSYTTIKKQYQFSSYS